MRYWVLFILLILPFFSFAQSTSAEDLDLLWQTNAYTSPLYKGKPVWGLESQITFYALPHLGKAPSSLIYRWTKDGTVLGSASGLGKNTLTITGSLFSAPVTVEVEVITDDEIVLADTSVTVVPSKPEVLVYENNPLYGILFNKEVGNSYTAPQKEFTLSAFPFFFSTQNRGVKNMSYSWNSGKTTQKGSEVVYRSPDNAAGRVSISLSAKRTDKILQSANKTIEVQFGNNENKTF